MILNPAPILVAIAASAVIALAAWRARLLTSSGALAALVVGAVATRAGYAVGAYLILWFVLAAALSRLGKAKKARRLSDVVEKSSNRDAWQVLANGGVFAALVAWRLTVDAQCDPNAPCERILVAAAASLAAAGADTWATEVGTLFGGAPWSARTWSRVPAGTSGAVTASGSVAMIAGAAIFALLALQLGIVADGRSVFAIGAGGVVGALADTAVGAWLQERRWCPRCTTETEQHTHQCGTVTTHHRGVTGLNNDIVNFFCTVAGAAAGLLLVLP